MHGTITWLHPCKADFSIHSKTNKKVRLNAGTPNGWKPSITVRTGVQPIMLSRDVGLVTVCVSPK
jgi:hypothetical protein